jgi:hypothetical protein
VNGLLETLDITTTPGDGLLAYGAVLALAAFASIAIADLPGATKLALATVTGVLLWRGLPLELGPGHAAHVKRAVLWRDGSWQIFGSDGGPVTARLLHSWGASFGPVIGIEWQCADGVRRRAWVSRAAVSGTSWRRLRVRLRLS